jgi:hypothetical protein
MSTAKRIPDLTAIAGASTANDDNLVIFDTDANETKRILRSQLAIGMVGDLPYTPSGGISATTVPTAIAELDSEAAKSAALAASGGSSLVGFLQAGTNAVTRTAQAKMRDVVSVKDFGAVGDGVTDDTVAIQAAADYCKTTGAQLIGVPGAYVISATLVINCGGDLSMMTLNVNAASVSPAVRIGNTSGSGALALYRYDLKLPNLVNTAKITTGWSGFENAVGVEAGNLYECRLVIPYVYGFGVGASLGGYTAGFVYNEVTLGTLSDNKINLRVAPHAATGWSNENNFYGGRFSFSSSEGSNVSGCRDILLSNVPGSAIGAPNNNVFYKPALENNAPEFNVDIWGSFNTFINPRFEVSGGAKIRFYSETAGDTNSNLFVNGYKLINPTYTFDGANSRFNKWIGSRTSDSLDYTGNGLNIANQSSSGVTAPHIQGFTAGVTAIDKTSSSTNWSYRLYAEGLSAKRSTDSFERARLDFSNGRLYLGQAAANPIYYFGVASSGLTSVAPLYPGADDTYSLGASGLRWTTVYATTPTINTSDERQKQDIAGLDAAEKRVAITLKGLVKKFRFKDAVAAKGDAARIHVGVIAQEVMAAFQAESLDPMRYGIVCYDEWEAELDDEGNEVRPAGNRYGVRYEELLAFIISAL